MILNNNDAAEIMDEVVAANNGLQATTTVLLLISISIIITSFRISRSQRPFVDERGKYIQQQTTIKETPTATHTTINRAKMAEE